ncbi:hypothetical protein U1Q18_020679 [Sarracenia purpurea var. burkii]
MGKRKSRSQESETLISCRGREGKDSEPVIEEEKGGFFACYLLTSLSPRHKGHTYIGFTVNPRRRIRQHNGEIGSGARRTKTKRPWEMVMCIYGFPTNVSALQFEWAWQHPTESLAAREAAATFKSLNGLANKIKLGFTMLTLPAWQNLHLTVNFFSTKYTKHSAGCPSLPDKTRVQVGSMDELPCYTGNIHNMLEDANEMGDDDETSGDISSLNDHWKGIGETIPQQNGGRTEDIGTRQFGNLLSSTSAVPCTKLPRSCSLHLLDSPKVCEDENKLGDDEVCYNISSHNDHWKKGIEETTQEHNGGWIEEIGTRQSKDLLSSTNDHGEPSSFPNGTFSAFKAVNDQHPKPFTLIEEILVDQPGGCKELPTVTPADTDQIPIRSPSLPCEVDVIDLLSPSPGYRDSSSRKRRKISNVYPEIIDLTKSPIFV